MIGAILSQWRAVVYGLLAAGLIIAGWTVNQWRVDASQLKATKAALTAEMEARVRADRDRVGLATKLQEAETTIAANIDRAKEIVRVYVSKDPRCDLEPSVVRVLRDARAGRMPTATDHLTSTGRTVTPTPGG